VKVSNQVSVSNRERRSKPLSLRKKLFLSLFTTVSFFIILEIGLAFVGFRPVLNTDDPFVGFSGYAPLMTPAIGEDGAAIVTTSENKRNWFNVQSFPKVKAPGTKRVFCMGGSTTYGHPFFDSTSFSGWLREFLPVHEPSSKWEVINAGGISYASYRVAALMDELSQYEPDLFIVYSVHNEFLERRTYQDMFDRSQIAMYTQGLLSKTRTWALTKRAFDQIRPSRPNDKETRNDHRSDILDAEVNEMLNHTIGPVDYHRDPAWRANVVKHYENNLRRMIAIARNAGAKIVFITPASNEKDCSPFKSEHDSHLSKSDLGRLQAIIQKASTDPECADPKVALSYLKSAAEISQGFAEYHYRIGQLQLGLNEYQAAQRSFSRAINEDVCPLRAVEEIRQCIERVGREMRVPIVDFERKLRALCEAENGHAILGEEYFLDHVHPTIDVNRRLAIWILEKLQNAGMVSGPDTEDALVQERYAAIEKKILGEVDPLTHGYALRNLAKVLHWAGKYIEAELRARDALKLVPDDPESRFVLADCLKNTGRFEEAIQEYEALFASGLSYPRAAEAYGRLLATNGSFEQAKAYLLLAIAEDDKNADAYHWLGWVHFQLMEFAFAEESLEHANQLIPNSPETLYYWARSKASLGKHSDAIEMYLRVLKLQANHAEAHYHLGISLTEQGKLRDAMEQFEAALKISPEWQEVRDRKKELERLQH
jgi:tetratricopeptide (TPR) repeat protein